jgi:hypothetical protein
VDSSDWIIWVLLLAFCLHKALQAERFYKAVKSSGAFEGRVGVFSEALAIRRDYKRAKREFIDEQKNDRQSAQ